MCAAENFKNEKAGEAQLGDKVVHMPRATRGKRADDEHWIWRQAVMILGQLPDDEDDATRILEKAEEIYAQHRSEVRRA